VLQGTHRLVIATLFLVALSGLLMFTADVSTFLYSRVFWIKMGLVALLVVNGTLLWNAERHARRGDVAAWKTLRFTALASVALWLLATLAGVALTNIG
jgi:cytochrome b subunit of formate dehydrogenase